MLLHLLATLVAVISLGHLLGVICKRWGQPAVIGQFIAGIVLGPSILGAAIPASRDWFIPTQAVDPHGTVQAALGAIAQLGVILAMFLVGVEFHLARLQFQVREAIAVGIGSTLIPGLIGAAFAWFLFPRFAGESVSFLNFGLFMGVTMAITAFPILARILVELRLDQSPMGVLALTSAAIADVATWSILAVVIGLVQSDATNGFWVTGGAIVFVVFTFVIARPMVQRGANWLDGRGETEGVMALAVFLLLWSLVAELIGIHGVLGAFLLGVIIPHDSSVARNFKARFETVVNILLLPAFFAMTGLKTEIGILAAPTNWGICLAVIGVATASKLVGTYVGARIVRVVPSVALGLGILMNARGLMELIVIDIGLKANVISPTLHAMLVAMAITTTIATGPLLSWARIGGAKTN